MSYFFTKLKTTTAKAVGDYAFYKLSTDNSTESIIGTWLIRSDADYSSLSNTSSIWLACEGFFTAHSPLTNNDVVVDLRRIYLEYNENTHYIQFQSQHTYGGNEFAKAYFNSPYVRGEATSDKNFYTCYTPTGYNGTLRDSTYEFSNTNTTYMTFTITTVYDDPDWEILRNWLKANATRIEQESVIGTWTFSDKMSRAYDNSTFSARFQVDAYVEHDYYDKIEIANNGWITYHYWYTSSDSTMTSSYVAYQSTWVKPAAQTIRITSEPTDQNFISWLKANATKIA